MTRFNSILVATDFSVDGNNAVLRAALLAQENGARLRIVHVLDATGFESPRNGFVPTIDAGLQVTQARAALRRIAVRIAGACDVTASVEVAVGNVLENLLQASDHAALVVLGQHGHRRLGRLLTGGTAHRMLKACRRPVLIVRRAVEAPYRRVLVPVDFAASSDAAVQAAVLLARAGHVQLFHATDSHQEAILRRSDVAESIIREVGVREEVGTRARMRREVARLGLDGAGMSFSVGRGPAARETLRHALAFGADLIVAGRQGRSTFGGLLSGSVSSRILSGSGCDVLIVPRWRDGPAAAPRASTLAPCLETAEQLLVLEHRMAMPITFWIDLTRLHAERCHHLGWFLYGCLEREHALNLDACAAWWGRGIAAPGNRLPSPSEAGPTPARAASARAAR